MNQESPTKTTPESIDCPAVKTLHNTNMSQATKNVKDIVFWGDGDTFKLICKASSEREGWMKSTKAMEIPGVGVVLQVTTQQKNPDGSYSIAEALTYIPGVRVYEHCDEDGKVLRDEQGNVIGRSLAKI
jgi:hypothetical protein